MPDLDQLVKEFNDNKAKIAELEKRNAEIVSTVNRAATAIQCPSGPQPRKVTHQYRGISRDVLEVMTDGKLRGVSTLSLMLNKPERAVRDACRYLVKQKKLVEAEDGFKYIGNGRTNLPPLKEPVDVDDSKQAVNLGTLSFRDPLLGGR